MATREPVNISFTDGMDDVIIYHRVNMILGAATTVVNLLLLFVFLSSPSLRRKSEVLMVLCLADGVNCFSIFLMGTNRMLMYSEVVDTLSIPIRTAWECAVEPWLLFRGYGDLWPPTVQLAMGVDRCAAVFSPLTYNRRAARRKGAFVGVTLFSVTCTLLVGYIISWSTRLVKVKYWCGRKAAFGNAYASFIYGVNIAAYILAFIFNLASYFKSQYWMDSTTAKRQLARIRYQLMISVLSIILISIPNGVALCAQYIAEVADAIAKPSTYLICVNSSLNIVVYLVLFQEFRGECGRIFFCKDRVEIVSKTVTLRVK